MPNILAGGQIFDIVFHPNHSTVYAGLITGHIKAFAYDEQGQSECTFSHRPSKRSCRALTIDEDGSHLYAVGKSKALSIIDTTTENIEIRAGVHDSPINRIKYLMPWLLSTGDDEGVIKLWDLRQREPTRIYKHHFDYITDFLWLNDKKHLVATSGDGTLSVMDVRSKKPAPFAQSEDQEDELLSIVAIKGTSKIVVGTQIGILSIFNRKSGWGDCVDRIPGHPHSIDTLCGLPTSLPGIDTTSTILTGSSDGLIRAVQILPTKLVGVVADHGEWPVERIAIGCGLNQLTLEPEGVSNNGGSVGKKRTTENKGLEEVETQGCGRWWVGSVGHEDVLRMTDLGAFFRESQAGKHDDPEDISSDSGELKINGVEEDSDIGDQGEVEGPRVNHVTGEKDSGTEEELDVPKLKKRKRKLEKDPTSGKKRGNILDIEPSFFDEL